MKTAILVMVRLGSTRLPQKAIKPIMGRPMICHMLDRWKLASRPEQIIICTTTLPEDDPLAEIAEQESVYCFRGHPDDVLLRLTMAAQQFSVDTVIVTSGDNPFQDSEYIDRLVDFHQQNGYDYSRSEGLPLGVYAWALSRPAMIRACQIKDTSDTAGWLGYFTEIGLFSWGGMPVDPEVNWPQLRLTVDPAPIARPGETLEIRVHALPFRQGGDVRLLSRAATDDEQTGNTKYRSQESAAHGVPLSPLGSSV